MDQREQLIRSPGVEGLLEQDRGRMYAVIHCNADADVALVAVTQEENDLYHLRADALEHAVARVVGLEEDTEAALKGLRENPVKPQYKWWSTGALMNPEEVRAYHAEVARLARKRESISDLKQQLEDGTYTIKEYNQL